MTKVPKPIYLSLIGMTFLFWYWNALFLTQGNLLLSLPTYQGLAKAGGVFFWQCASFCIAVVTTVCILPVPERVVRFCVDLLLVWLIIIALLFFIADQWTTGIASYVTIAWLMFVIRNLAWRTQSGFR